MAYRWWVVPLGSLSVLCVFSTGPVSALPTHELDMGWGGWGKGGFHAKHHYKWSYEDNYEEHGKSEEAEGKVIGLKVADQK